jgi:hypothetical protein
MYDLCIIIIISLLMSPLLEHRPSLWINHKENEQVNTRPPGSFAMDGINSEVYLFIYLSEDQLLNLITLNNLNKNIKPFTGPHQ